MKPARQLLALSAIIVAGCSGGNWVDVPTFKDCKILDGTSKDLSVVGAQMVLGTNPKETVAYFARATCSTSGKAWTGDTRCGDTGVQVKCK
ncbi:MAG: hypothetical protein ACLQIH_06010 [Myxococcaceae bacterium]